MKRAESEGWKNAKAKIEEAYRKHFPEAQANRWDTRQLAFGVPPERGFYIRSSSGRSAQILTVVGGTDPEAVADSAIKELPRIIERDREDRLRLDFAKAKSRFEVASRREAEALVKHGATPTETHEEFLAAWKQLEQIAHALGWQA